MFQISDSDKMVKNGTTFFKVTNSKRTVFSFHKGKFNMWNEKDPQKENN